MELMAVFKKQIEAEKNKNVFYRQESQNDVIEEESWSDSSNSVLHAQRNDPDTVAKNFMLNMISKIDFFIMGELCYHNTGNKESNLKRCQSLPNEIIESDLAQLQQDRMNI